MRYEAKLTAYDCLDQVVVGCSVWSQDPLDQASGPEVLHIGCQVRGEGITDARQWLQDALLALVETL